MEHSAKVVKVRMRGERALFSNPLFNKHRVTFPCPVFPSLLGALEAVYWKPEMEYSLLSVGIISAGTPTALAFNHTKNTPKIDVAKRTVNRHGGQTDVRSTVFLSGVDYLLEVGVTAKNGDAAETVKHSEILKRRVGKGQHFRQPFLGAREMVAEVLPGDEYDGPFDTSIDVDTITLPAGFVFDNSELGDTHKFCSTRAKALYGNFRIAGGIMERVA